MTNATIIFNESLKLMEQGILKGTGEFLDVKREDGTSEKLEVPEEIHTFNGWKKRGFAVRKGEKSQIKFTIWKFIKGSAKTNDEENEEVNGHCIMKLSAFFKASQVEKVAL